MALFPPPSPFGARGGDSDSDGEDGGGGGGGKGKRRGKETNATTEIKDDDGDVIFVPYVKQIVVEIRLAERLILIDPPDGLLELIQPKREERVVIRGLIPAVAESLRERAQPDGTLYSSPSSAARESSTLIPRRTREAAPRRGLRERHGTRGSAAGSRP